MRRCPECGFIQSTAFGSQAWVVIGDDKRVVERDLPMQKYQVQQVYNLQ